MGKHSAPESPGFWRAVMIAGLRYLVIVALIAAVGFGIYKLAFDRDNGEPAAEEELSPLPADPFREESPDAGASPSPSVAATATGKAQVLDASNSRARLDAAERKLEQAGYDVVAKGNAANPRDKTTVVYHPGNQQMGEAVASLLGVGLVQPVGEMNLDPAIPVTVIIGPDFAG